MKSGKIRGNFEIRNFARLKMLIRFDKLLKGDGK